MTTQGPTELPAYEDDHPYAGEEDAPRGTALARRQEAPLARRVEPGRYQDEHASPDAPVPRESADIRIVAGALAKAQARFPTIRKNRVADAGTKGTYTYANLSDVCRETLPILAEEGLFPSWRVAADRVFFRLTHAQSSQFMESDIQIVAPDARKGIQALGSALSYARRYLYVMMVGIVAVDDDDDGVASMLPEGLVRYVLDEPDRAKVAAEMARKKEPRAVQDAALRIWDQAHPKRAAA